MERNIRLFGLFNFFTDFKFHSAVLIIYFVRVTGSYTLAAILFSTVMIASAIFEVPTGICSDIIGRKRTITFGAISATLSAILYATGLSFWLLFVGAVFEGLSRAWYSGNNDALLYESVSESNTKETFAHHLGKTSSMFQLALMIGAVAGSFIAQWSFPVIMWLSVIPQFTCLILSFFFQNPTELSQNKTNIYSHIATSIDRLWRNKKLRLLSISDIVGFGAGESSFQFNAAFIATLWPIWAIGLSRLISFGGAFISFQFSGKIIRKLNAYNVLIIANVFTRIVNIIAYVFPTVVSPVLMATPSFWYGAHSVSKTSLMQNEYASEQRATLASVTSLFGSLFYGVFAALMGIIADVYNPKTALLMAQLCMVYVLYINIQLKRLHNANIHD